MGGGRKLYVFTNMSEVNVLKCYVVMWLTGIYVTIWSINIR